MDENETPTNLPTPESEPTDFKPTEPENLFKQFYRDIVDSLTEPKLFFTNRYPKISLSYALAFTVVVNWISDLLQWLTRIVRHETLLDGLLKMRKQLESLPLWKELPSSIWAQVPEHTSFFPAWLAEVLGVTLSPLHSLFRAAIGGVVLWIGALLLVPKDSDRDGIQLANFVKLVALVSAPNLIGAILGFLPMGLGAFFAWIFGIVLMIYAISLRYKISKLRSIGVMIIPGIVLSVVATCVIGVFMGLFFGIIAALFGMNT